jgi:uncharacterized protein (DUF885 family)
MKHGYSRFVGALALGLAACARGDAPRAAAPPVAPVESADERFAALEHEYVVYFMSRFPVVATYLGGAAFDPSLAQVDAALRDHSAAALVEEDARWTEFHDRFAALTEAALSARRQIDRRVALAELEFLRHQHQVRRHQQRALDTYVDEPFRGVDWQIQGMTGTGADASGAATLGTAAEWRQVIARERAIPAYLAVAEQQLAAGVAANNTPDWRMLAQYGLGSSVADAEYFAKALPALAEKNLPAAEREVLRAELLAAGAAASAAYLHLRDFVVAAFYADAQKSGRDGLKPAFRADHYAAGEAEYDWALRNNLGLQTSAAQLFDEAWPIVESTRQSMIALAGEIAASRRLARADGPGSVRNVFEELGKDAPKTDDEMLAGYIATGQRLVQYARSTGLFDVPADYQLDVSITPPPLRSSIEGAAYYPAPPFKQSGVGRFYVTPTDNDPALLRQEHNRVALADLAAHEGFPGHDWHYKVMAQHRDEIAPVRWLTPGAVEDSSSMWQDSMAAEGWALYSEALLAEPQPGAPNGFYTPEERLYQLRGKLYRDLRVRVDIGIHTGRISFDDAVTLFSEVVDFQPGSCAKAAAMKPGAKRSSCEGALGAITRYSKWPTQAITYRLGKDQILALRQRAQQALGDKFSAKNFHVEFMKQGTLPASYFGDDLLRRLTGAAAPDAAAKKASSAAIASTTELRPNVAR